MIFTQKTWGVHIMILPIFFYGGIATANDSKHVICPDVEISGNKVKSFWVVKSGRDNCKGIVIDPISGEKKQKHHDYQCAMGTNIKVDYKKDKDYCIEKVKK